MTFQKLIYEFLDIIINYAVPTIFGLAVLYFLYGALMYIKSGGSQDKRSAGVKFMTTAVISLFIMLTIWSIVGVFSSFFGSKAGIPQFKNTDPAQQQNTVIQL